MRQRAPQFRKIMKRIEVATARMLTLNRGISFAAAAEQEAVVTVLKR